MTQRSRPQAENINTNPLFIDSGPYSGDQWRERMYAAHTGDENTAGERTQARGVVPTFDNMLNTSSVIVGGQVIVNTGAGMTCGSYLFNSAPVQFDVASDYPAANPRIDLVCMVENNTNVPVADGTEAAGWIFPTVLADYNALSSIPGYTARLVIVKGTENAAPVAPVLDQSNTLWMVPIAEYEVSVAGVFSNFVDRREFVDIEKIVGVEIADHDTIENALIIGTEVNNGAGVADLGVGIRALLENAAGDKESAGQIAFRWTDPANGGEDSRYELRLSSANADNLSAVINAPAAASVDGNARGVGAVDLQQVRILAAQVASGIGSFVCCESNTASGRGAHAEGNLTAASGLNAHSEGYLTTASGNYSHAEGNTTTASGDYSHAEGGATNATADYTHAEGGGTTASAARAHAEGAGTVSSGAAAHAEGDSTTASGAAAHAEGNGVVASGAASHAGGASSLASKWGQFARSGSSVASDGDTQYSDYHLSRTVTHSDANWYELFLDGAGAANRLTVATDQVMTFDILIVGTTAGCTKSFSYRIVGAAENDGGTTSILAQTVTMIFEDDADFNARVSADDPNDAILVEVTDATSGGNTVRWSAVVRTSEVTFPA